MNKKRKQPVVLILADGFGLNLNWHSNAIATAGSNHFFDLWQNYRHLVIKSALADSNMSPYQAYSELSTGQKIDSDNNPVRISKEILAHNHQILTVFDSLKRNNASIHLIGNITKDGQDNELAGLIEIIKFAKNNSILNAYIHLIIDDSNEDVSTVADFLNQLEAELHRLDYGQIATISGQNQLIKNNFKNIFKAIYLNQGKTFLSAKQIISSIKGKIPAKLDPSIIKSRKNQWVSNFDLLFFFTPIDDKLSALLREMILQNENNSNPSYPSFLEFFAISEFPFDLQNDINFLFYKDPAHYLSNLLHAQGQTEAVITDRLNLVNVNYYFIGSNKFVDMEVVETTLDPQTKKNSSTTAEITKMAISQISKNIYNLITINFPSLYRFCLECSFDDCVKEVKLLDEMMGVIGGGVLDAGGTLLFCPTFGGAELIEAKSDIISFCSKDQKSATLPFIMISDATKFPTKSNLFHEILQSQTDLTSVNEVLKIILLAEKSNE